MDSYLHLDLDPDIIDKCEEIRTIASKKWTNASSVSLAKLDQIKTKVYNLGLTDPQSLKSHHKANLNSYKSKIVDVDELKTEPPLSSFSYQKTAWGSNNSIPELMKQQAARSRPTSANVAVHGRPYSGRMSRPNSAVNAKPPLPNVIKVQGCKYDPESKKQLLTIPVADGWAAPETETNHGDQSVTIDSKGTLDLQIPVGSPEHSDDEIEGRTENKRPPSVLLRKPKTPEPLHLQLPTVDKDEDENVDEDDDSIDTERLLERANASSNSKSNTSLYLQFLVGSPEQVPSSSAYTDQDLEDLKAEQRSEVIEQLLSAKDDSSSDDEINKSKKTVTRSPSILICEDKNKVYDIPSRQTGKNSRPTSASKKIPSYKHVQSRINSGIDKNMINSRRQNTKPSNSSDVSDQEEETLPISVSKITVAPVPNTIPDKEIEKDFVNSSVRKDRPKSALKHSSASATAEKVFHQTQKSVPPVSIVTVDYGEEGPSVENSDKDNSCQENDELSSVSLQTPENSGKPKRPTSARTKNYYEESLKKNDDKHVFKTTKTFGFGLDGPIESSIRSALDGQLLKPTEPLAITDEQLKKAKQTRPPSSKKQVKPKAASPVQSSEPEPEDIVKTLIPDIHVSVKTSKSNSMRGRLAPTPISVTPATDSAKDSTTSENKVVFLTTTSATEKKSGQESKLKKQVASGAQQPLRTKSAPASRVGRYGTVKEEKLTYNPENAVFLNSKNAKLEVAVSNERKACQDLTEKLAQSGVNIRPETLERALYPPTGRTLYYDIPGYLPQSSSSNLLSHPKVWIPEEYKRFKNAEKQLERAEHILWLQKKQEEREQRASSAKTSTNKKRKRKGKKLLRRSQTTL